MTGPLDYWKINRTVRVVSFGDVAIDSAIKNNFSERRLLVFRHSFTIRASSETYILLGV
jgi:hypothetical protein